MIMEMQQTTRFITIQFIIQKVHAYVSRMLITATIRSRRTSLSQQTLQKHILKNAAKTVAAIQ